MRIRALIAAAALAAAVSVPAIAGAHPIVNGTLHEFGEEVDYDMLFPVALGASYTYFSDTFWAPRSGGQIHHATDIMAPKMTPVVAPVDGNIGFVNWTRDPNNPNWDRCCNLTIEHDDGWSTWFIHLNNDTPGTDDGLAWGIAPGIAPGVRVRAGQLVGWVGDSGNAENTGPHLHFELRDPEGIIVNPYQSLLAAPRVDLRVLCLGEAVTLLGTSEADELTGTEGDDVIHGLGGDDVIDGGGGNDLICGGAGHDTLDGGDGDDQIEGRRGGDLLRGGPGDDILYGGVGNDTLEGGSGHDKAYGEDDNDRILGGPGDDILGGAHGNDTLDPGNGTDYAFGSSGKDIFIAAPGANTFRGGNGNDTVDYRYAEYGVMVDLAAGTGIGDGTEDLGDIEHVNGSPSADVLTGDDMANILRGSHGDDILTGAGGDDRLNGGKGADELDGGEGDDRCRRGFSINCETPVV